MKPRSVAKLALFLTIFACFAPAQTENTGNEPLPKFTSQSEVVLVPVVVKDDKGQHVSGLKKEDFVVKEKGKLQELASVEEITTQPGPMPRLVPPGYTYSNLVDAGGTPRQINIVVLDLLNTPFLLHSQVRKSLVRYLLNQLENEREQAIALVILSYPTARSVHPASASTKVLYEALKWVAAGKTSAEIKSEANAVPFAESSPERLLFENEVKSLTSDERGSGKSIHQVQNSPFLQRDILPVTLRCMEQLAQAYAGLPGRKSVLWITAQFPLDMTDRDDRSLNANGTAYQSYKRVWAAFNNANMSVYPVDAMGIVSDNPAADPSTSSLPRMGDFMEGVSRNLDRRYNLVDFAESTGGRACHGTNDLTQCYSRALRDSSGYYMLAYRVKPGRPGWRDIEVASARKDLKVQARKGYFYGNNFPENKDSANDQLNVAFISAVDYTSLPFAANLRPLGTDGKNQKMRIEFNLPFGAFQMDPDNTVKVRAIAVALDDQGKFTRVLGESLSLQLTEAQIAIVRKSGLRFSEEVSVPPGHSTMKVVLVDDLSGKLGTITAPIS